MRRAALAFTASALTLALTPSLPASAPDDSLQAALRREVETGALDGARATLYAFYAHFDRDRLPERYRDLEVQRLRCATPLLKNLQRALPDLPDALRAPAETALAGFGHCNSNFNFSISSATFPITVHYNVAGDAGEAMDALTFAEEAWQQQVIDLGFSAPLLDGGDCGPDSDLDIFIDRSANSAYTLDISPNPATFWDDHACFIVIDPQVWGGVFLETTVAHEFNHAVQAADDWWEVGSSFEATSTLIEEVADDSFDYYHVTLADFNTSSARPFEHNDNYFTYFMYGGMMQLLFYRDRYFAGDISFVADAWIGSRSTARGCYCQPGLNEPDFHDALDAVLQDQAGVSYVDALIEFSRWRWFVGSLDDGQHFEEGGNWPNSAQVDYIDQIDASDLPLTLDPNNGPWTYGVVYLRLVIDQAVAGSLCVTFDGEAGTDFHVETMRRGAGLPDAWAFGTTVDGSFDVELTGVDEVLFKVLNLATPGYDPDFLQNSAADFTLALQIEDDCGIPGDPADLNGDGAVDVIDLLALLAQWGPCPGCDADLDGSGVVDVVDLLQMLSAWS